MKTARAQITEAAGIFEQIMRENLSAMAEDFVAQIMSKAKRLPEGQWGTIPNGLSLRGVNAYKETMLTAMAVVAGDALTRARKEVPKAAKVKLSECDEAAILLGEWEKLPAKIRKRLGEQHKLLIDSQIGDVQKSIVWQFSHSHASTDSLAVLENDISAAAKDYISSSVHAASGLVGAQVVNEVRNAFFLEDEVLDQLDAFQFVNDDPVTAICDSLAGQYFPKDDPNLERYTPPLHWNAVLSGTLIATSGGHSPIETLKDGDFVLTHAGRFRPITEFMSKFEDQEFFEVTLDSGRALCLTGEHPVLTKNRGWVRADELSFSDDIVLLEDVLDKARVP